MLLIALNVGVVCEQLLKERATAGKLGGVLLCVMGVVCEAFGDERQQKERNTSSEDTASHPLLADAFTLLSALCAAGATLSRFPALPLLLFFEA